MSKSILIAGIGNVFLGDDAFGVEVVEQLTRLPLPEGVHVTDFGIRGYDLAYALTDAYDSVILVVAAGRGKEPGTVYLIEPDMRKLGKAPAMDAHSLDPIAVLKTAQRLGRVPRRLYLVGCQPEAFDPHDGEFGLSATVRAAVPRAIEMIQEVIAGIEMKPGAVIGAATRAIAQETLEDRQRHEWSPLIGTIRAIAEGE